MQKQKRKQKRRRMQIIGALCACYLFLFAGCGGGETGEAEYPDHTLDIRIQEDVPQQEKVLIQGRADGGRIAEDERAIYLFGSQRIEKIDKESGERKLLWQWETQEESGGIEGMDILHDYNGCGLLVKDRLYFIVRIFEEDSQRRELISIRTDGEDVRHLGTYDFRNYSKMFFDSGTLYINSNTLIPYGVEFYGNGETRAVNVSTEREQYRYLPKDYKELHPYEEYKETRPDTIPQMQREMGDFLNLNYCLLLNESGEPVRVDAESGEEKPVDLGIEGAEIIDWNRTDILWKVINEETEQTEWYLQNMGTQEKELLFTSKSDVFEFREIAMDYEYVYTARLAETEEETYILYERIGLDSKEAEVLFKQSTFPGREYSFMDSYGFPQLYRGYIYYLNCVDYQYYLCRASVERPGETETLGEAVYDSGIGAIGNLDVGERKLYSKNQPDAILCDISWIGPMIDEEYPGAEKINRQLQGEKEQMLYAEVIEEEFAQREEALGEGEYYPSMIYHDECHVSEVSYFDGSSVLSFCGYGYLYTGGAHGITYQVAHTYNLQTGEELTLEDVIWNSEEELKEIVVEYFGKIVEGEPEMFWDDALDTVYQTISYDFPFYLTEEGICFHYDPYALACYAAGEQELVIPYEEFRMKWE